MGHTLAEKIIAAHVYVGKEGEAASSQTIEVWPGDLVEVALDIVLANDITAPI